MTDKETQELAKSFEPNEIEARWYPAWEKSGCFKAGLDPKKPAFSIQLPPPNITGILHMGHAFNQTVMDTLTRYHRMAGYNTMWLPGTDHAGIATQIVVERKLEKEGISRRDMKREDFIAKIWEWQKFSGGTILEQMRRMGDSVDWDRLYFTMNPKLSKVVIETFVKLYEEGLIYRGKRLVNWDPKLQSAVSDLEVESEEADGHLWEIRYPGADGSEGVIVATTRPETLFGDQAVAVHPEDERYKSLVGKMLKLPLTDREIPVIADEYVDREFGSGCVKITPAHDFNDFEVGRRHNLAMLSVLTKTARMNENVPAKYQGMDRYECRKAAVEDLKAAGLLVAVKPIKHMVPRVSRTGEIVEPMLSEQWYMAMSKPAPEGSLYPGKSIAEVGLDAVESGEVNIFPAEWRGVYRQWLENIQDWCLSRQLWWGHQIPAWYDESGRVYVARTEEEAQKQAGEGIKLTRDEDVLDTWFSSALVPFSTLGWPHPEGDEKTAYDLYLPSTVLVTGYDILFFWVARMIMAGYEYEGKMPFKNVYFTGIVRDKLGRKMSKSLGNSPDPLELIEKFGADGVRMGMMLAAPAGNDILFDDALCEQGRNFCNKIWNAYRLVSGWTIDDSQPVPEAARLASFWFESKQNEVAAEVADLFSKYRLSEALMAVYKLFWDEFSSWYLEIIKPAYGQGINSSIHAATIGYFDNLLHLLHPFMPFITEELWQQMYEREEGESLMVCPLTINTYVDGETVRQFEVVKEVISNVRSIRLQKNIAQKETLELQVVGENPIAEFNPVIMKMCNLSAIDVVDTKTEGAASFMVGTTEYAVPLGNMIDVEAEIARMEAELKHKEGFLQGVMKKLGNEKFVNNAPAAVLELERKKQADAESIINSLKESIAALKK